MVKNGETYCNIILTHHGLIDHRYLYQTNIIMKNVSHLFDNIILDQVDPIYFGHGFYSTCELSRGELLCCSPIIMALKSYGHFLSHGHQ